jgi:hypothetical protein
MKKLLLGLLIITGFVAKGQVFNNEWIDYSKTYYKFKVGKTGLYRISQSVLSSAGLGSTSAEYFQLWRNGKQIPIYTSVATGILSASDYIEFWGQMNDGKPDRELYRDPNWQLNDKWSLETDTAAYFLAVNTNSSTNLRLLTTANNVSGTSLTPDSYFLYTTGRYFRDRLNPGYAVNVGEYMYSSSYDKGEGWSSNDILTSFSDCTPTYGSNLFVFQNLNVFKGPSAPAPKFSIAVSGNQINQRRFLAKINSDSVLGDAVDFFNYTVDSSSFSLGTLNGNLDTVSVFNYTSSFSTGCPVSDRMTVHRYEITYPRTFNFDGQSAFEFTLAANVSGNFLQITNFNSGSSTPVLYDLTNGKRYSADVSSAPTLKFVLDPSFTARNLVLVNEDGGNVNQVPALESRNFINYTDASNQGDYLIISDPLLFAGAGGTNPVDEYRQYRSSAAGGSYTAKIYLVDQINDQFGFGIKKNPAAVRNFLRYARNRFTPVPKHVFLVGRGMTYVDQRVYESYPYIEQLNLIPTYGNPASDVLLAADPGSSKPTMSIGRLSAITPAEVAVYLKKVKDYEQMQATQSPLIKDKGWMKNIVHIVGASDEALDSLLTVDLRRYKGIISDTLFGANVHSYNKTSTDAVSQLNVAGISELFEEGISVITYFGHSSANTLEFNLDNPQNYNNYQKYPLFIAMGCNAGAFFNYTTARFQVKPSISENYVLAPDRGTIGFIASTHFGIVPYLDIWAERAYKQIAYKNYGSSIGEILKATAADVFNYTTQEDFYARCNTEQTEYNGDPAIRVNSHTKPDYVIEDSLVQINPAFVSVADHSFKVNAKFLNIGRSPDSSVVLEIKRQLPDGTVVPVHRDTIPGIRYSASMNIDVPIDPRKDKGLNKLIITVDPDNKINELFENNNTVTKDVMIYEDEAKPIYPYNFAIVNKQNIKLVASTANPFADEKQYKMELDTSELFRSPDKIVKTITSKGGLIEFDPGILFRDSTVYYWRVASSDSGNWSGASFVYLPNGGNGFNQSHFFQQDKSTKQYILLDSATHNWNFENVVHNLFARNTIYPYGGTQESEFIVSVDGDPYVRSACVGHSLIFNVFDKNTVIPWSNVDANGNSLFRYGSESSSCLPGRQNNFEFSYMTPTSRKVIMDFMDTIPIGAYVVVRSFDFSDPNSYSATWRSDTTLFGAGNSLYDKLLSAGFTLIDSLNTLRSWILIYQKGVQSFQPKFSFSEGLYDKITCSADVIGLNNRGYITSPVFGPAKSWKQLMWDGYSNDIIPGDNPLISVMGIRTDGRTDTLFNGINTTQRSFDISSINAAQYPFVQLQMQNTDLVNYTPYQLKYWRLTYDPAPEGAVSPNIYFQMKDTVEIGEPVSFKMAFKNVSQAVFSDSLKIKAAIIDRNNVTKILPTRKLRPLLLSPDTLYVSYPVDTRSLKGQNTMFIEVNPDNDQPEQYHFNNFFYRNFYVRGDTTNPLLDITFDNVHILNGDVVSSKPSILIKLKDEAKWFPIDDPSSLKIQVRFPDGTLHPYSFNSDTLQFTPAGQQVPITNNTATAVFKPYFQTDGKYELLVTGKDMSDNNAGSMEYRVGFEVINKAMISNMMNYPNPFTTSTAFVFTLTGSEVPQNIRIQILTVTGKVVREITKDELGPLHIGRNITEFRWDGTDQYGQNLANGVYLYRVITNLNGKSLEKYKSAADNTDQYFNKGYGKMYLMR